MSIPINVALKGKEVVKLYVEYSETLDRLQKSRKKAISEINLIKRKIFETSEYLILMGHLDEKLDRIDELKKKFQYVQTEISDKERRMRELEVGEHEGQ